jgi:DNA replication protein DnaC
MTSPLPRSMCDVCEKETDNCLREQTAYSSALYRCPECVQELREKKAKEKILRELPEKFLAIETDHKELLKQSIGKSLFIFGDIGVGKSVFMASLLKEAARSGKAVKWISYISFIMSLQNLFHKGNAGDTAYDEAERVARFDGILFIDDLGAEKLTEFVRHITYYLFNEREQRNLATVVTSNFSLNEIDLNIDRRISSRICGMCSMLNLKGKDRRKGKGGLNGKEK